ncbi:MAG TPA: MJ0042-type zinc finger domain-containing protein [Gemmataceae bacterium]|jgi:predicted Zn finger-like uncharacterized protein|nr:MJ0042-type zinc finger domain-containing protein [Gemmataceae bacterium]
MPEIIHCPQCQRQLRVPEDLFGRAVKCPSCGTTFTAGQASAAETLSAPAPAPPEEHDVEEPPRPRRPRRRQEDDDAAFDYDDEPGTRWRRDAVPHRGGLILTLGILSLVCCWPICGPMAWVMGNTDLREIRAGRMDRDGEGLTNAGRICGMVGVGLGIAGLMFWAVWFVAMMGMRGFR